MSSLDIASICIAGIVLLLSILSQVALWQTKEYRWDRVKSHLKSPQGSLVNYPFVLLAMLAILVGWLAYISTFLKAAEGVGFLALIFFFLHHAWRIRNRGVLRPDFTLKAISIIILTLVLSLASYFMLRAPELLTLQLATHIFVLPGFVALTVAVASFLSNFRKRQIIRQAKWLRNALTHLTVVGVTGSYGKTSTKHFLEQILKNAGKNVAATREHHNTPIGVAQDMLTLLPFKPDIFIAELSAYRRGEIKELTEIVQPKIGVITAIGNQHIDLFGSQENILRAKWELIEALPKDGVAVLNADDARLTQKKHDNIVWFSAKRRAEVWVEHVSIQPRRLTCTLHLKDFVQAITLPLASEALLSNVLAGAAACLALEISPEEIVAGLKELTPFPQTMEIREGKQGATIIDDSYSANENGTLLAIRHMGRFSQPDKRVVLLPLIELGSETKNVHQRIEEAAKKVGAKLYLYDNNPKELAQQISQGLSEKSAVLLEGRLPDMVRKAVL